MPDKPTYSKREHPASLAKRRFPGNVSRNGRQRPAYAELQCKTNFSFLRGASHPEELAERAAELGYEALAITDRNTLAGVVRMHCAAKACDLKLIVGAEVTPQLHASMDGERSDFRIQNSELRIAQSPIDDALRPFVPPSFRPSLCLYATDRDAYGRLCRIITQGTLRSRKGKCRVVLKDIADWNTGLLAAIDARSLIAVSGDRANGRYRTIDGEYFSEFAHSVIGVFHEIFKDRLYLAAGVDGGSDDERFLAAAAMLSWATGVPMVAANDVYYHVLDRRFLQDVLTCIRNRCTIAEAGRALFANAERHLKPVDEMYRLFADYPQALARTVEIAERCNFTLDELRYEYPEALAPPGRDPADYLAELTRAGAARRYPGGVPEKVQRMIEHELVLIRELNYEPYFLTVWDIVDFARSRGILCQGRGSAANSAVCYCLGITDVDPDRIEILFERFVSAERNEPPDIDVDFEHERREEVIQYIYDKYGRDHAGITAEVITYRPRSAIRDVGKALGLSADHVDVLAKQHEWWDRANLREDFLRRAGLNPGERTIRMLTRLVGQLIGFPRHLSQHVGGFVITRGPLCEMVPIENGAMPGRTFIEWDKDDIDALGILKVDCLGLGMLTAIRKCIDLLNRHEVTCLADIPAEDPAVYEMIRRADTVGVFQIESRAQMSMLPRLKPKSFYDLVIEVAIVRPGPIQGGMVHPYLRRRNGEEPVTYPNDSIRQVLERTLGVPLFQEQAMRLAIVAAGFTPGEADQLRRAMAAWRRNGDISRFRTKLIDGMRGNGLPREFAERCFEQISGFGEYGFPESHAASFALLVYASAWLKRYHPAAFCAALINSQPLGFYQPAQLVRDAREHVVCVLPIDVNESGYDCRLEDSRHEGTKGRRHEGVEPRHEGTEGRRGKGEMEVGNSVLWGVGGPAVRLGMRLVKGISEAQVAGIERAQAERRFTSVEDLSRRSGAGRITLARLAAADAMRSLGLNRRAAVWNVLALSDEPPLFRDLQVEEPAPKLPEPTLTQRVFADYDTTGLSLIAHPISLIRGELSRLDVQPNRVLRQSRQGQRVCVSGLALVRQRPSTAGGITFCTLEDESGTANLIIRPAVFEKYRPVAGRAVAVIARGRIERQGEVVHVQVERLEDMSAALAGLCARSRDFH